MANARPYEEEIIKEIRVLPDEALPKVLRLISLVREEFFTPRKPSDQRAPQELTNHERTRKLLATSTSNWAHELLAERENRL